MAVTELTPDGSQVVCIDGTSKNELKWACHYGRAMSGTHATPSNVFMQGDHYSLVATITIDGYLAVDVVEGSYNSELFYNFIAEKVVWTDFFFTICDPLHTAKAPKDEPLIL
ncbi:hypothetical protein PAXRUDRAFT_136009 [Paxillus rubicundulus Ve08.2h10]|uniref:Uncharacterized protein n=1 Tax=Paxillus rubicundulus Ve08.2h10 TaxID=930991 RepID=A0A0D0DU01_9AGAM|nr:hypothetical protein PAXRUDRAFT_136009 [Paxillus rubicundulus Ve08.2h10]